MSQPDVFTSGLIEKLGGVFLIPTKMVRPFPDQPRQYFDQQKLKELAASIRAIGQIVPCQVKAIDGDGSQYKFELVDGQRRLHALDMAKNPNMKAVIVEAEDVLQQFMISVVANFGREDHTSLEIAHAIQKLRENGKSIMEISQIFAKSETWVYQHLRILELVPEVQKLLSPEIPEDQRLTFSAALILAEVSREQQATIAERIIKENLRLGQIRSMIRRKAEEEGFTVGSPDRTPRKDYRNLDSFIRRVSRDLDTLLSNPQSFFSKMFEHRDPEDRDNVIIKLGEIIEMLEMLIGAVKKTSSEKKLVMSG